MLKIIKPITIAPICLFIKWKLSLYNSKPRTEDADKFNKIPKETRKDIEIIFIF